jgi:sec-independent protein translocase protein TatA
MIAMVLGVLLFGRRLPELGRALEKWIVEFMRGLTGREDGANPPGNPGKKDDDQTPPGETPSLVPRPTRPPALPGRIVPEPPIAESG